MAFCLVHIMQLIDSKISCQIKITRICFALLLIFQFEASDILFFSYKSTGLFSFAIRCHFVASVV